jgi:uncharacterized protein YndB with AHSA1/START domain
MAETANVTVHIEAPPERVYELVADVPRMGEWSPECVGCEWLGGVDGAAVGARFKGSNKRGLMKWSTTAEVVTADPGREFAFTTQAGSKESTRWRYQFDAVDGGTDVTESFEAIWAPAALRLVEKLFMRNRGSEIEAGMRTTLERIKAAAEQGA